MSTFQERYALYKKEQELKQHAFQNALRELLARTNARNRSQVAHRELELYNFRKHRAYLACFMPTANL